MFLWNKNCSKNFAKERLKTVLISERIACTPQTMIMMTNDIIQAVSKYFPVDEKLVKITYSGMPPSLDAHIPIQKHEESEREI